MFDLCTFMQCVFVYVLVCVRETPTVNFTSSESTRVMSSAYFFSPVTIITIWYVCKMNLPACVLLLPSVLEIGVQWHAESSVAVFMPPNARRRPYFVLHVCLSCSTHLIFSHSRRPAVHVYDVYCLCSLLVLPCWYITVILLSSLGILCPHSCCF